MSDTQNDTSENLRGRLVRWVRVRLSRHPIPSRCPSCGGPVERVDIVDTPIGTGYYRCPKAKPRGLGGREGCYSLGVWKAGMS